MSNSIQHKLSRVRPPRVQITYDVETGGALEKKELPFIVGIIADLSGSKANEKVLRDRKMINIDRDNFNKVLESIQPTIKAGDINNTLDGSGTESFNVDIAFKHIDDFDPIRVVENVGPLNALYQERSRLRDFLSKLDGNDKLNNILVDLIKDKDASGQALVDLVAGVESSADLAAAVTAAVEKMTKPEDKALKGAVEEDLKDKPLEQIRLLKKHDKISAEDYDAAMRKAFKAEIDDAGKFINVLADGEDAADGKLNPSVHKMLVSGQLILEENQTPYALELIVEYTNQIMKVQDLWPESDGKTTPDYNVAGMISKRIAQKDKTISLQLNYIIHHKKFQELEASWRGLHFLVMNTETNTKLKLRLLNATYDELYKDLDKAVEFDQSSLFKIIYEEEYGTFGGEPYSVLIGDFQFGRTARDMKFLEMMSGVAAAAHAPFIASAYAKLFDLDDFGGLHKPRDLSKIFESAELIQWRAFRETEDSRYVTLTLPRVMLRLPYHHENNPIEGIYFDEDVAITALDKDTGEVIMIDDPDVQDVKIEKTLKKVDARKILWGNPAYILGQRITNAFSLHGWTAAIRGVEGGGLVEGLPAYTFETESGDIELSCPTEVSITDRREKELNDLGFMAICHCKGTNKAAFFGGQSTNKPKMYLTDSATANARISAMLPYVMSASRFAHYIKVLMREKIGSFMTRQNVENYLNTWIAQYVLLDDTPPQHIKAKYPLREARIDVTDVPGKPGAYRATVFLKPHFQLEELTTSIRLVADLPS